MRNVLWILFAIAAGYLIIQQLWILYQLGKVNVKRTLNDTQNKGFPGKQAETADMIHEWLLAQGVS